MISHLSLVMPMVIIYSHVVVHDAGPVLTQYDDKHCNHGPANIVKIRSRRFHFISASMGLYHVGHQVAVREYAAVVGKEFHAKERENEHEEDEQNGEVENIHQ